MSELIKPIEIAEFRLATRDLSNEQLEAKEKELKLSVSKLQETNLILKEELVSATGDDFKLYEETIEENMVVLERKNMAIELVEQELTKRGIQKKGSSSDNSTDRGKNSIDL